MFDAILGNEPIKVYLSKALKEEKLPHALLFAGPDGIGKSLFAKALALHLLKTDPFRIEKEIHPDYHPMRPEGKSGLHAIETLREVMDAVYAAPFEAPAKVFVFFEAERMQPAAANALLKTLEEPPLDTTFILLTSSPRQILPTILSRCIHLNFQPLKESEIAFLLEKQGHSTHWARFAHGSMGKALELAQNLGIEKTLFSLLSQKWPYHHLCAQLEKLEAEIEDEDPVCKAKKIERLFATMFMWFRDQNFRKMGVPLFFPEECAASGSVPSLERVEAVIVEARLALERNVRLSSCLERLWVDLSSPSQRGTSHLPTA